MNKAVNVAEGQRSKTHLYRCFGSNGELLYVGISHSALSRFAQHRFGASWFDAVKNVTVEAFQTRKEALAAEGIAIRNEKPLFNVVGARSPPTEQIGVRIPFATQTALAALAKAQRRSVGFVVRDFIEAGLQREAKTAKRAKPAKR